MPKALVGSRRNRGTSSFDVESLEGRRLLSATVNPGGAPNGPFGLAATAADATDVQLSFYDSSTNETGFVVERATGPDGSYAAIGTIDAAAGSFTTVTYVDNTAAAGTSYTYRVYAVNGPYQSAATLAGVTTPGQATASPAATPTSTPYTGTPVALAGTIQLENYDNGGEGVAYHDSDGVNQGGAYRADGVDIESLNSGGYAIDFAHAGEWLNYTVSVGSTGTYGLTLRANNALPGGAFHVEVDGVNVTGSLAVPNTGDWGVYADVTASGIALTAGQHVVTLVMDADSAYGFTGNFDSMTFTATPTPTPTPTPTVTNVDATKTSGSEMESQVAINPTNTKNLVLVAQNDVNGGNLITVSRSIDGGRTWLTSTLGPSLDGAAWNTQRADARVIFDRFGNCYVVYMVADSTGVRLASLRSTDGGATFSFLGFAAGGADGINPDGPQLAVGAYQGSATKQGIWIVFTDYAKRRVRLVGGTSTALGKFSGWGTTVRNVSDKFGAYASLAVGPNGELAVAWQSTDSGEGPNNIMFDVDASGTGKNFGTDKVIGTTNVGGYDFIPAQADRSIDAEVKLAFDTSSGPNRGRLYLAYTDELIDESNDTDIFLRYSDDLGSSWSTPTRVNDDATTMSQFLPALAVDPTSGDVALSWYDARNSVDNTTAQLFAAISTDHGATFSNVQISAGTSNQAWADPSANDLDYGDNGTIAFDGGQVVLAWSDNSNSTDDNPDGTDATFDILTGVLNA